MQIPAKSITVIADRRWDIGNLNYIKTTEKTIVYGLNGMSTDDDHRDVNLYFNLWEQYLEGGGLQR